MILSTDYRTGWTEALDQAAKKCEAEALDWGAKAASTKERLQCHTEDYAPYLYLGYKLQYEAEHQYQKICLSNAAAIRRMRPLPKYANDLP